MSILPKGMKIEFAEGSLGVSGSPSAFAYLLIGFAVGVCMATVGVVALLYNFTALLDPVK